MLSCARQPAGLGIPSNEMQRSLTGLGDIPNDFEAYTDLQYYPVRQGWYYGYPIDGRGYPRMRVFPSGLGRQMKLLRFRSL